MESIGILGGTFNPVHIVHIRLALEVREQLGLSRLDLVPVSQAPHKDNAGLLPFAVRMDLVQRAVAGLHGLTVNSIEARRQGPSYTYDTLQEYHRVEGNAELFFIMGSEDVTSLPQWYKGLELPDLAHLVVVCRAGWEREPMDVCVKRAWPGAVMMPAGWRLPGDFMDICYLEMPRLDISASMIRTKWATGRSLRFLVPGMVEKYLEENRQEVGRYWGNKE
ncbi:MAG: nicotinate (nicotinamide) nucleotide adenylyltransferase [Desulfoplanes sp.]